MVASRPSCPVLCMLSWDVHAVFCDRQSRHQSLQHRTGSLSNARKSSIYAPLPSSSSHQTASSLFFKHSQILNIRTFAVKFLSAATAVGSGLPVGPEGPMIHMVRLIAKGG